MKGPRVQIPPVSQRREYRCDVLVIGGGTAGSMAALERRPTRRRGAAAGEGPRAALRGVGHGDGRVNNAVIPGKATPEDYVADITLANDGIVNQAAVYQTPAAAST